jgi:hypothetical protein
MTAATRAIASAGLTLVVFTAAVGLSATPLPPGGEIAGTVKVTVKYTGKGQVDATHRLWIWLFDSPDIGPGAMPVAELSLDANGATADFADISSLKVWIAVAYDEQGGFTGSAPPPSGTPIGIYMNANGPAAASPDTREAVVVTFDDSQRMP